MSFVSQFKEGVLRSYNEVTGILSPEHNALINAFIFAILITFYSIFTWKFYKNLSHRDLLKLNLAQYNTSTHPVLSKFFGVILYIIEYILILPFLIFFWFAFLALLIILISDGLTISQVVLITASVVASIRILAYYDETLSGDVAKMFPFIVLTTALLSPSFFSTDLIVSNFAEIPLLLGNILYFLVLIMIIEMVLRMVDLVIGLSTKE